MPLKACLLVSLSCLLLAGWGFLWTQASHSPVAGQLHVEGNEAWVAVEADFPEAWHATDAALYALDLPVARLASQGEGGDPDLSGPWVRVETWGSQSVVRAHYGAQADAIGRDAALDLLRAVCTRCGVVPRDPTDDPHPFPGPEALASSR